MKKVVRAAMADPSANINRDTKARRDQYAKDLLEDMRRLFDKIDTAPQSLLDTGVVDDLYAELEISIMELRNQLIRNNSL